MFENKLKVEKVEMVKRIIRQNNYHQCELSHQQCQALGLNVNLPALERFSSKLELIDRAALAKRQDTLHQIDIARHEQEVQLADVAFGDSERLLATPNGSRTSSTVSQQGRVSQNTPRQAKARKKLQKKDSHAQMSYAEVKQRETEITFELGELKIRENELMQELISLSVFLDNAQVN